MKFRDFMKAIISTLLLTLSVVTVNDSTKVVNAAVQTVTYTVNSITSVTTSGTAVTGSTATFNNTYTNNNKEQMTKDNSMTLTVSGLKGYSIKGITLYMRSNGSTGAGTLSVTAGTTALASISSATTFNKWYDNTSYGTDFRNVHVTLINSSYIIGNNEDLVIVIAATANSLYCRYFEISYDIGKTNTLTYEPNYDGFTGDKTTVTNPTSILSSCPYTRDGYEFYGWTTNADGTGDIYYGGESYSIEEDTPLYAKWVQNPYHVVFVYSDNKQTEVIVPNEKNAKATEPTDKEVGSEYVIGWYTDTDKTIGYDFNTLLSTLDLTNYTLTLYAKTGPYPLNYSFVSDTLDTSYTYTVYGEVTGIVSNKYFYIQTNDGYLRITYSESTSIQNISVGNEVTLTGKFSLTNSLKVLTLTSNTIDVTSTENETIEITAVDSIVTSNEGLYAEIKGAKVASKKDSNTFTIIYQNNTYDMYFFSDKNPNISKLTVGKYYDIDGIVSVRNSNPQLYPTNVSIASDYKTVTFNPNGGTLDDPSLETQSVWPGDTISSPTATNENLEFQGWYTDEELTNKWNFADPITSELNFKAKWGESITDYELLLNKTSVRSNLAFRYHSTVLSTKYTDTLNATHIGVSSYSDWTGKSSASNDGKSSAVYAGYSTKNANSSIQLKSGTGSGIVSTTSGGKIKKVTIVWDSAATAANRTIDVYGAKTAYTSAADLYSGSTDGDKLGSIYYQVDGNTTTVLTIDGDYLYVGIRSSGNTLYISSITFEWEVESGHEHSNSDFRMMLGIEDDFFTNAAKLTNVDDYGIFVSNGTTDEYLLSDSANKATYSKIADDNENLYNHDDTYNISYVILDLGDIFENEDRAEMSFYTRAYITVGDTTYYSEWQEFIVLAMLEEYNEMDDYKDLVSECYEYLKSLLTPAA